MHTETPPRPGLGASSTQSAALNAAMPNGNGCANNGAQSCGTAPTGLTPEAREAAIRQAGEALLRHMAAYQLHKALYDRYFNDADRVDASHYLDLAHDAKRLMETLIRGRDAATVARMERERGLDRPACANDQRGRD